MYEKYNSLLKKKRTALCILNFRGTAEILNVLMEEDYYGQALKETKRKKYKQGAMKNAMKIILHCLCTGWDICYIPCC